MATYYRKGRTYTVAYRLKGCPRCYIYGIQTESVARRAKLLKDEEEQLARAGLLRPDPDADRWATAQSTPLIQHVQTFQQSILDRCRDARYARQQASLVKRIFELAKIKRISEIACEPVQRALSQFRGRKHGPRTCNSARQALIQFERHLNRVGAVRKIVLSNLQRFNEAEDIRRKRRPLNQMEVNWLLATTHHARDRTARRCGISPADRAMLYATGIGTGFRRSALLSLRKESFHLAIDIQRPFVELAARFNKNRKNRRQAISDDLASRLREWLAGKNQHGAVWQPLPHADLSLRFRRDLEAARIAWIRAATDDSERLKREQSNILKYVYNDGCGNIYADFHSLRHTGITFAVRRAGIRIGQEWADHSTPMLTSRYAAVDDNDLQTAIAGLPVISTDLVLVGRSRRNEGEDTS